MLQNIEMVTFLGFSLKKWPVTSRMCVFIITAVHVRIVRIIKIVSCKHLSYIITLLEHIVTTYPI